MADFEQIGGEIVFPTDTISGGDTFVYKNLDVFPKIGTSYVYDSNQNSWTAELGVGIDIDDDIPEITQYPIIESADNFTGTTIRVTQNALAAFANKTGEAWFKDGVDLKKTGNSLVPKDAGKYKYVEYFTTLTREVLEAESNELEIDYDMTKPFAEMYGLRFDANTKELKRSGAHGLASSSSATVSVWFKPSKFKSYDSIICLDGQADSPMIAIDGSGSLYSVHNAAIVAGTRGSKALELNKWHHIVLNYNSVNNCEMWLNGQALASNAPASFASANGITIGNHSSLNQYLDGYLSDLYFVDGQALPPTAFGKDFGGKWGPLDSSLVYKRIGEGSADSPYDNRPNMDEKWSDKVNVSGYELGFDGDPTTPPNPPKNKNYTFTANIPFQEELKVYYNCGTGDNPTCGPMTITMQSGAVETIPFAKLTTGEVTIPGPDTLLTITGKRAAGGRCVDFSAIEVDGRFLVDGPADNSKNWSENLAGATSAGAPLGITNPNSLFSTDIDTSSYVTGSNATLIWDATSYNFSGNLKVKIYDYSGLSVDTYYEIKDANGVTTFGGDSSSGPSGERTVDLGTVTNLEYVKAVAHTDPNATASVYAIYFDDKLLVDSGTQWNTSQVWSDYGTGTPYNENYLWKYAFNGELNTTYWALAIDGTVYTWEPPTGVQFNNLKLKFVGELNPQIKLNGASYVEISSPGTGEWDYEITTPGTLEGLKLPCTNGAVYVGLKQITIDGKILVDGSSFGPSGFHLPFDPEAEGVVHPAPVAFGGDFQYFGGEYDLFNGDISKGVVGATGDNAGIQWIPSEDITGSVDLKVAMQSGKSTKFQYSLDNKSSWTDLTTASGTYNIGTVTITSTDGIAIQQLNGTSNEVNWQAIYVDGQLLVNCNNIGVDSSGNDNHFHDKNFTVGNASKVWSNDLSAPTGDQILENPRFGFDGSVLTEAAAPTSGLVQWGGTLDKVTSLEIKCRMDFNSDLSGTSLTVSGTGITNTVISGNDVKSFQSIPITSPTVSNISITSSNSTLVRAGISAIKVNGQILVDGNAQDTVKDTPMTDYAVLSPTTKDVYNVIPPLSNGNLEVITTSERSVALLNQTVTSGKYYYEYTCFKSSGDLDQGIRFEADTLDASTLVWQPDGTTGGISGNPTFSPYGTVDGVADILGCAVDLDALTVKLYLNGTLQGGGAQDLTLVPKGSEVLIGAYWRNANGHGAFNLGQQPFANPNLADNDDGTVTIDGEVYNTFYKEWAQWARTPVGYLLDEVEMLEKRNARYSEMIEKLAEYVEYQETAPANN